MLRGYRMDNSKSDSPKPAYSYTPDPKTRYNPIFYTKIEPKPKPTPKPKSTPKPKPNPAPNQVQQPDLRERAALH